MIRRQNRLRREYIYKKSLEAQQVQTWIRKQNLKKAALSGAALSKEAKAEAAELQHDLVYDESQPTPTTHEDDEYAFAGSRDPKIMITTSRDPSSRLQQFSKRVNRGNSITKDLVSSCQAHDVTDLIILHEHRGQPDGMIVCHFPYGPTAFFSLHNVVMRHDIECQGTVSEAFPQLIFNNFNTRLGQRVRNILKFLFPVPKEDSKRVMTFVNENDYISFRHHVYHQTSAKQVQLAEVGPRFEMRLYQIKLGTVDVTEADDEWVLRPYMRTAKKRTTL